MVLTKLINVLWFFTSSPLCNKRICMGYNRDYGAFSGSHTHHAVLLFILRSYSKIGCSHVPGKLQIFNPWEIFKP